MAEKRLTDGDPSMKLSRPLWLLAFAVCALAAPLDGGGPPDAPPAQVKGKDVYSLELESLLNVKVTTASKAAEKLSSAPGVMSVVTQDELRRFGAITLRDALERVPGLAPSTASGTDRSVIAVRGDQTKINGGHVLILINGRPTRETLEGGLIGDLLESFPVAALERIEVIRGPGSVLYGSNAFSGVINLITRKAEGHEITVTGLGAQGGGAAASVYFAAKEGALNIVGAAQFHQKPYWTTRCHSLLGGDETIEIPNRGTGAYLGMNYKGLSLMSAFTEYRTSYIVATVGPSRWRRGFADLGYTFQPRKNWDVSLNVTYTRNTMNQAQSIPYIARDSYEALLEWSNAVKIGDRDRLTVGTLYNHIQGSENVAGFGLSMPLSNGSREGGAFYAQWDHQALENLNLIGGVQVNKIGNLKTNAVPRAGVVWSPAPRVSLKALYSGAFRAPSINENLLYYMPPSPLLGPSIRGSQTLRPEKVATVDLGLSYQGDRFQAGFVYFHSRQTDNIILDTSGRVWPYTNTGRTTFQGVELEGKYYLTDNWLLTGSFLHQTNQDGAGRRNVTPIANLGATAGASYESPKGFSVGVFDVFQGPIHGFAHALNPKPGAYNLLDAHIRFDLGKRLGLAPNTGLALLVHAKNLTNKQLWLPDWKNLPNDSIFFERGRTIYFGVEVSLKRD